MDLCTPLTFQLGVILNAAALRCFSTMSEMTNHAVRSCGLRRYAITCSAIPLDAQKRYSRPSALAREAGLPVVLQRCRLKIGFVARVALCSIVKNLTASLTPLSTPDSIVQAQSATTTGYFIMSRQPSQFVLAPCPKPTPIACRGKCTAAISKSFRQVAIEWHPAGLREGADVPTHRYMLSAHSPYRVGKDERTGYHKWQASMRLWLCGSCSRARTRSLLRVTPGRSPSQ